MKSNPMAKNSNNEATPIIRTKYIFHYIWTFIITLWPVNQSIIILKLTIPLPIVAYNKKSRKYLWLYWPIQLPVHGQWWSILKIHLLQCEQWWVRGGLTIRHLLQY